jgi:hypothetical protein
MIESFQKHNFIPNNIIELCLDEYKNKKKYETHTMNKAGPNECLTTLVSYVQSLFDYEITYCTGNFYKHSIPYLPHTDFKPHLRNVINVVIPLEYTKSLPYLVVFDQEWHLDSTTWCMQYQVQSFEINIGVKGCPYEYPVKKLTGKRIDPELRSYLPQYPEHTLFGLNGNAYPFEIGSIIVFDCRKLHATSNFTGEKTGISLRFRIDKND